MNTTLHPNTDSIQPTDDRVSSDPWALGENADLVIPSERPPQRRHRWLLIAALILCGGGVTAIFGYAMTRPEAAPVEKKDEPPPPAVVKRTEIRKNLFFEVQGDKRRVIVVATVVLREGQLEGLMCRTNTKEHEYILATDVDARDIHTALLAANAKPGTPVQFAPKYVPASGSVITVSLQYKKDGKLVTVRAQDWIEDVKTKKPMTQDWVFGGSRFVMDPENIKNPVYLANHGDVICVCNMESAMMDLPIRSPQSPENRIYNALTESIPPKETRVEVILEVVPEKK